MENEELPREEVLVRLYELKAQMELYDVERWLNCADVAPGKCADCASHRPLKRYGEVEVCEACGLSRIRVASLVEAGRLARQEP